MKEPLLATCAHPSRTQPCYLYIMSTVGKAGDCSPVKIGIASNPEKRLASIQTACPNPIRMETFFGPMDRELARAIEREVHSFSAKRRLHGEWFDFEPAEAVHYVAAVIRVILSEDTAEEILGDYREARP